MLFLLCFVFNAEITDLLKLSILNKYIYMFKGMKAREKKKSAVKLNYISIKFLSFFSPFLIIVFSLECFC